MCHWATYIVTYIYTQGQSRCLGTFQVCMLALSQIHTTMAAGQSGVSWDDPIIMRQPNTGMRQGILSSLMDNVTHN